MSIAIAGRNMSYGALLGIAGGIVAVVGVFLPWLSMTALGMSEGGNGIELNAGKIVLALGIAAIVAGGAWALKLSVPMLPLATLAIGVAILVVLGLAYFADVLGDDGSLKEVLDMGSQLSQIGGSVSLGIGFILGIVGGALVAAGGALGLVKK